MPHPKSAIPRALHTEVTQHGQSSHNVLNYQEKGDMMGSLIVRDKEVAKKKGLYALGAWGGSAVLFGIGSPFLGVVALGGAGYLTYRWFMFRAKRGMRF